MMRIPMFNLITILGSFRKIGSSALMTFPIDIWVYEWSQEDAGKCVIRDDRVLSSKGFRPGCG